MKKGREKILPGTYMNTYIFLTSLEQTFKGYWIYYRSRLNEVN